MLPGEGSCNVAPAVDLSYSKICSFLIVETNACHVCTEYCSRPPTADRIHRIPDGYLPVYGCHLYASSVACTTPNGVSDGSSQQPSASPAGKLRIVMSSVTGHIVHQRR